MIKEIELAYYHGLQEATGYEPFTTFYTDFCIADAFGKNAIQDTYNRAFAEWKDDYKYLTELVMILNRKIWYHYQHWDRSLANLYDKLWNELHVYACEHLKWDELSYYIRTTD